MFQLIQVAMTRDDMERVTVSRFNPDISRNRCLHLDIRMSSLALVNDERTANKVVRIFRRPFYKEGGSSSVQQKPSILDEKLGKAMYEDVYEDLNKGVNEDIYLYVDKISKVTMAQFTKIVAALVAKKMIFSTIA
ncbi:hypothetical protein VTP01DRAFT_7483 [Rhizomucor pusillus]|uniref:uncharacterized protein n=1 Tax=Rhizomucor pusillus TaxID=4840 RepID=UPI003741E90C